MNESVIVIDNITNPKDIILLNYNAMLTPNNSTKNDIIIVGTYELNYRNGKLIALGIYSDDIINNGSFNRYLESFFAICFEDLRTEERNKPILNCG